MKAPKKQKKSGGNTRNGPFIQRMGKKPMPEKKQPFLSNTNKIQPKLTVSQPGDRHEQEADRMADHVMRMPQSDAAAPMISRMHAGGPPLQRVCKTCEEQMPEPGGSAEPASVQRKAKGKEGSLIPSELIIQRKHREDSSFANQDVVQRLKNSKGQGEPLPQDVQNQMERSFGADFSAVRVHTGSEAAQMNQELNAFAFTHGSDIYFNQGMFDPYTSAGKRLLGHELTHVVQQGEGVKRTKKQQGTSKNKNPNLSNKNLEEVENRLAEIDQPEAGYIDVFQVKNKKGILTGKKKIGIYIRKLQPKKYLWDSDIQPEQKPFKVPKKEKRRTVQRSLWKKKIRVAVSTQLKKNFNFEEVDKNLEFYLLKENKDIPKLKGSYSQILEEVLVPFWDIEGNPSLYDVEHMVDWQIMGSKADNIENLILLSRKYNRSLGTAVRVSILAHLEEIRKYYAQYFGVPDSAKKLLSQFDVYVEGFDFKHKGKAEKELTDTQWYFAKEIIEDKAGNPFKKKYNYIKILKAEESALGKKHFALKTTESRVGYVLPFNTKKDQQIGSFLVNTESKYDKKEDRYRLISLSLAPYFKDKKGAFKPVKKKERTVKVQQLKELDPSTYLITKESNLRGTFGRKLQELLVIKKLSRIKIDNELLDGFDLFLSGNVVTDLSILQGIDVDFQYQNGEFFIQADIPLTHLESFIPDPIQVESAGLFIRASSREGLSAGGNLSLSLPNVGQGEGRIRISSKDGLFTQIKFAFEQDLFDKAKLIVGLKKGALSIGGELSITKKGKIPGLKSANLKINYDSSSGALTIKGDAFLDVKGQKEVKLGLSIDDKGLAITGDIDLATFLPNEVIKSGNLTLSIQKDTNGYALAGKGTVTPNIPGVESPPQITIEYDSGKIYVEGRAKFKKEDKAAGNIQVGLTNQKLDENNRPTGELADGWTFFGGGDIELTLSKGVKGKVKAELQGHNGHLLASGAIVVDRSRDFDTEQPDDQFFERLFSLPGFTFPLLRMPIVSLDVSLSGYAAIYGGLYRPAVEKIYLVIDKPIDLTEPKEAPEISGGICVRMAANAGVMLSLTLAAELDLRLIKAKGGLTGKLKFEALAKGEAVLKARWSPTNGLSLEQANVCLSAKAKLKAELTGWYRVYLDLWLTKINIFPRTELEIASKEFDVELPIELQTTIGMDDSGKLKPGAFNKDSFTEYPDVKDRNKQMKLAKDAAKKDKKLRPPDPPSKEKAVRVVRDLPAGTLNFGAIDLLDQGHEEETIKALGKFDMLNINLSRDTYIYWLRTRFKKIDWGVVIAESDRIDNFWFNKYWKKFDNMDRDNGFKVWKAIQDADRFEKEHPIFRGRYPQRMQALKDLARGKKRIIQYKLNVNQPGDRYEQEANRMADHVMRMPKDQGQPPTISRMHAGQPLQRMCSKCQEEHQGHQAESMPQKMGSASQGASKPSEQIVQRKCSACGAPLQMKAAGENTPAPASDQLAQSLQEQKGQGVPLPADTQHKMEDSFGSDFSDVRVHTGSKAEEMNDELNAQAFTQGSDIYFNRGKFQPETDAGQRLLGHELTHVVQQNGDNAPVQRREKESGSNTLPPQLKGIELVPPGGQKGDSFAGFESKSEAVAFAHQQLVECAVIYVGLRQRYHVVNIWTAYTDISSILRTSYGFNLSLEYQYDPTLLENSSYLFDRPIYLLTDEQLFRDLVKIIPPDYFNTTNYKIWLETRGNELQSQFQNIIREGLQRGIVKLTLEERVAFDAESSVVNGAIKAANIPTVQKIKYYPDLNEYLKLYIEKNAEIFPLGLAGNYRLDAYINPGFEIMGIIAIFRDTNTLDWYIPYANYGEFKANVSEYEARRDIEAFDDDFVYDEKYWPDGYEWDDLEKWQQDKINEVSERRDKRLRERFGDVSKTTMNSKEWFNYNRAYEGISPLWVDVANLAWKEKVFEYIPQQYVKWRTSRSNTNFADRVFKYFKLFSWEDLVAIAAPGNLDFVIRRARGADAAGEAKFKEDDLWHHKYSYLPHDLLLLFRPRIQEAMSRILAQYVATSYLAAKDHIAKNPTFIDLVPVEAVTMRLGGPTTVTREMKEVERENTYKTVSRNQFIPHITSLVPSHLEDKAVIDALYKGKDSLVYVDYQEYYDSGGDKLLERRVRTQRTIEKYNWVLPASQEKGRLDLSKMHWIQVEEPVDASATEVAQLLYEDSARAYVIVDAAPYFAFSPLLLTEHNFQKFYHFLFVSGFAPPSTRTKQEWVEHIATKDSFFFKSLDAVTPSWIVSPEITALEPSQQEEAILNQARSYPPPRATTVDDVVDLMQGCIRILDRIKYYTQILHLGTGKIQRARAIIQQRSTALHRSGSEVEAIRWGTHAFIQYSLLEQIRDGLERPAMMFDSYDIDFEPISRDRLMGRWREVDHTRLELRAHHLEQLEQEGTLPPAVIEAVKPMVGEVYRDVRVFTRRIMELIKLKEIPVHGKKLAYTSPITAKARGWIGVQREVPEAVSLPLFDLSFSYLDAIDVIEFVQTAEIRVRAAQEKSQRLQIEILEESMLEPRKTLNEGEREVTEKERTFCDKVHVYYESNLQKEVQDLRMEAGVLKEKLIELEMLRTQPSPPIELIEEKTKALNAEVQYFSEKMTLLGIEHSLNNLWNFLSSGYCVDGFLADLFLGNDKYDDFSKWSDKIYEWQQEVQDVYDDYKSGKQEGLDAKFAALIAKIPQLQEDVEEINEMIEHYSKWEGRLNIVEEILEFVIITVATWGIGALVQGSRALLAVRGVLGGGLLGGLAARTIVLGVDAAAGTILTEVFTKTDPNKSLFRSFMENMFLAGALSGISSGFQKLLIERLKLRGGNWEKIGAALAKGGEVVTVMATQFAYEVHLANEKMKKELGREMTTEEMAEMGAKQVVMFFASAMLSRYGPMKQLLDKLKNRQFENLNRQLRALGSSRRASQRKLENLEKTGNKDKLEEAIQLDQALLKEEMAVLDLAKTKYKGDTDMVAAIDDYSSKLTYQYRSHLKYQIGLQLRPVGRDSYSIKTDKLHGNEGVLSKFDELNYAYRTSKDPLTGREIVEAILPDGQIITIQAASPASYSPIAESKFEVTRMYNSLSPKAQDVFSNVFDRLGPKKAVSVIKAMEKEPGGIEAQLLNQANKFKPPASGDEMSLHQLTEEAAGHAYKIRPPKGPGSKYLLEIPFGKDKFWGMDSNGQWCRIASKVCPKSEEVSEAIFMGVPISQAAETFRKIYHGRVIEESGSNLIDKMLKDAIRGHFGFQKRAALIELETLIRLLNNPDVLTVELISIRSSKTPDFNITFKQRPGRPKSMRNEITAANAKPLSHKLKEDKDTAGKAKTGTELEKEYAQLFVSAVRRKISGGQLGAEIRSMEGKNASYQQRDDIPEGGRITVQRHLDLELDANITFQSVATEAVRILNNDEMSKSTSGLGRKEVEINGINGRHVHEIEFVYQGEVIRYVRNGDHFVLSP